MRERSKHAREPRANASGAEATSKRRVDGFGRPGAREQGFSPTDFGCPDCRGVLYVAELGEHGFLSFRCRVGHVFSADTLLELKEDRLDESLWTAYELFDELVQIREALGERNGRAEARRTDPNARRISQAKKHRRTLRTLLKDEGAAPRARR